jgi:hypothetical protein
MSIRTQLGEAMPPEGPAVAAVEEREDPEAREVTPVAA